jgi:hypothetical protein
MEIYHTYIVETSMKKITILYYFQDDGSLLGNLL